MKQFLITGGAGFIGSALVRFLIEASTFVQTVEKRQGFKVACLEEIAWRNGWLSDEQLRAAGEALIKTGYGQYLLDLLHARPRQY